MDSPQDQTQDPQATAYGQAHAQFSGANPPDPNTFLQMIWPHLTEHQKDLIKALMSNPQMAGNADIPTQGDQPDAAGAPQASAQAPAQGAPAPA